MDAHRVATLRMHIRGNFALSCQPMIAICYESLVSCHIQVGAAEHYSLSFDSIQKSSKSPALRIHLQILSFTKTTSNHGAEGNDLRAYGTS